MFFEELTENDIEEIIATATGEQDRYGCSNLETTKIGLRATITDTFMYDDMECLFNDFQSDCPLFTSIQYRREMKELFGYEYKKAYSAYRLEEENEKAKGSAGNVENEHANA